MNKLLISAFSLFTVSALAGPPMICHPINIGSEKSLPWGKAADWDLREKTYNVSNLVADTLNLLTPATPVIVRMETLRRAAIYASPSRETTLDLGARLMARAVDGNPASVFDAGYFVETVHQLRPFTKSDALQALDGYSMVQRSLKGASEPAAVEYALGLMQSHGKWPNDHFKKAVAATTEGTLLTTNILKLANQSSLTSLKASLSETR